MSSELFSNQNPRKCFKRFEDTRHLILHPLGFCTGSALTNDTIDKKIIILKLVTNLLPREEEKYGDTVLSFVS